MDRIHDIICRVEEYAAESGSTPEAVCRAATNNPRLWDRLKNKIETVKKDADRLAEHMRKNPVKRADGHNITAHATTCRTDQAPDLKHNSSESTVREHNLGPGVAGPEDIA